MKPIVRLAIGAAVTAVGLLIAWQAERALIAEIDCEECDDEETPAPATEAVAAPTPPASEESDG